MDKKPADPVSLDNKDIMNTESFARICKALGHPARVRILKYLKEENRCICGQIVEMLPLAQSTVSQHLKILKDAGLIKGEVEGLCTCYCIDLNTLEDFRKMAAGL
ncbi:MAG: metalloregulator ArsR/SmtB family transcription factor [Proteobacteria bacterium]|nr:metalloregulator ArsR/SmtB family transcription factor [Pseudomonadota bacterium]